MSMDKDGPDLGPLAWVKPEVDNALVAARQSLTEWNGEDINPLRSASIHLHQVYGALHIVDLKGISQITAETEHLLQVMTEDASRRTHEAADVAIRSIAAIKDYVEGLMNGLDHTEMRLVPIYTEVVEKLGGDRPAPSDLFFPDVERRLSRPGPEAMPEEQEFKRIVHSARSHYQRGLLMVLQNKTWKTGLGQMEAATRKLCDMAPNPTQYTFWRCATGLMQSLQAGVVIDPWVKRLCGRIDLQIRRLMEGSYQLADRLLRDMLYFISTDTQPGAQARAIQEFFELKRLLPAGGALNATQQPELIRLREQIEQAKEHWMRYCGGRIDSLRPFQNAATSLFEAAVRLPNAAMHSLARIIQAVAKRLPGDVDATGNERLQIELATSLLLAGNAAGHFTELGSEFNLQAEALSMRVQAALDPSFDSSRIPDVAFLDEISRKAQERLVVAQVTQEIQSNLNRVEEILDRFFRNAANRGDLPNVPGLLKQILGALTILEQGRAVELVQAVMQRISHLSAADSDIPPEDLNWVAEALSSLGLYVDGLRYGKTDTTAIDRMLVPRVVAPARETSVETQIRAEADKLQEAVSEWAATGADDAGRQALRTDIVQLARDADLVGDQRLRSQADLALKALEMEVPADALKSAVEDLAQAPVAAPEPSPEAVRLAQSSDETIEREMLDTYIEEAQDVLGSIAVQLARLAIVPMDSAALATIRRGFHTLKGSGRMVGLHDLGELAWEVEQTLNLWLRDENPPTPALIEFMEFASDTFQDWVDALAASGQVNPIDGEPLVAAARAMREPQGEPSPPKPEAGGRADSPAAGTTGGNGQVSEQTVDVAGHRVHAELFRIFIAEAAQHLRDLGESLAQLTREHQPSAWDRFMRAAHTLAGISRTTGFTPLAEAAHAVEVWSNRWDDKTAPLPPVANDALREVHGLLEAAIRRLGERRMPDGLDGVESLLATVGSGPQAAAAAMDAAVASGDLELVAQSMPDTEPAIQPEAAPTSVDGETTRPEPASGTGVLGHEPPARPVHPVQPPRDEFDPQLMPIFLEEAAEILPRVGAALRDWRAGQGSAQDVVKRALHTLKGSARMAGAMTLGELVHGQETRVIEMAGETVDSTFLEELEADYDRLHDHIERLRAGPESPAIPVSGIDQASQSEIVATVSVTETSKPGPDMTPGPAVAPVTPVPAAAAAPIAAAALPFRQTMRLKSDILDTLLNEAGEVAIARNRIDSALTGYKQTAIELAANVERLRAQLRELEIQAESQMHSRLSQVEESNFDPLEFDRYTRLQELTRLLAESVNDVSTAQDNLLSGLNETDNALTAQARMTRTLQQEIMHIRMVPLDNLSERLHRVVRQSAKDSGRRAQLEIDGGQTELDRSILDKIAAPLEHLVRNAVAHGIESPRDRVTAGKDEYGEVRLSASQEGNEIVIVLADDGAGIDYEAVRRRAVDHGLLKPDQEATHAELESFLFHSGFSTAGAVTELAGRGIGLDVVKNEIAGIGGRVFIESEPGKGTRFTVRLPLTLALTQVVLARAGGQTWALPANLIALVREVRASQMHALHEARQMTLGDESYPLRTLAELVGLAPRSSEGRFRTFLLLRAGTRRLAVRVDQLEGNFEAVVKNIGPQLARIAGVSGATVLGDGRVALIIDPFRLAERAPQPEFLVEEMEVELAPLVMVVDDSLTVRKFTGRFLEREGFRVVTARDGVEALEKLEEEVPVVMLLDIEMPRMDGFEVAHQVRANSRTRDLPIVMITSRTADKHRRHAFELGVNAYLGKPYNEDELLGEIERLSGIAAPARTRA